MTDSYIVCPHCNATNRLPAEKLQAQPKCGSCHQILFSHAVIEVDFAQLQKHIAKNTVTVLVDFWAPWCAPCRMMAPVFQQAAEQLEPHYRLLKANTENHPELGNTFGIRGIPTLIMFQHGREKTRISGAMQLPQLLNWVRQNSL